MTDVRVAQLDRATGYGPVGRGFESFHARCKEAVSDAKKRRRRLFRVSEMRGRELLTAGFGKYGSLSIQYAFGTIQVFNALFSLGKLMMAVSRRAAIYFLRRKEKL